MALVISLTTPVERGIAYFNFLMCVFGFLLGVTMVGIIFYLLNTGLVTPIMVYENGVWSPKYGDYGVEETYFSWLVLCGIVMMGVFLVPIILRPLDFLMKFQHYILGLLSYLFMMPTFINVMQIYAMCNLHDISWGNRPT
jgi:cellulose synthase/poly-beta-1,6-N-acetylglucosamine synthase-like glycosyltransferase